MSQHADILRSLNAPLVVKAAQAGADALDERPQLLATIAHLEARLRELQEHDPA